MLDKLINNSKKIINTTKKWSLPLIIATTMSYACTVKAEEKPVNPNTIYAGSMITTTASTELDTIIDYQNESGTKIIGEVINNPWQEKQAHQFSLGFRSPEIFKIFQASLDGTISHDKENWGYRSMLNFFPTKNSSELQTRVGFMQNSEKILGGFVGTRYFNDFVTLDGDLIHLGKEKNNLDGHGFIAGLIPTEKGTFYLSIGGEYSSKKINSINGWINPTGFGLYNQINIDLENKTQQGKLMIVPEGSTYQRGKFDFKSWFNNNSECTAITNNIIVGWAPFDAFAVDGKAGKVALVANWNNSSDNVGAKLNFYYRPIPEIFLGIGSGDNYNKDLNEHNPNLRLEVYGALPGTPLEAWISTDSNLRTGKLNQVVGYIGLNQKF